ncbi:hypothetical protein BSKO_07847 [Bryopsis sp. KO-2023]|nr:hypothetical protein BSKO_07847 [Bryopsis sp. KO-2023]
MGDDMVLVGSTFSVVVFIALFVGYALYTWRMMRQRRAHLKLCEGGAGRLGLDADVSISDRESCTTLEGPVVVIMDSMADNAHSQDLHSPHASLFSTKNKDQGSSLSGNFLVFSSMHQSGSMNTIDAFESIQDVGGLLRSNDIRRIDGFEPRAGPSGIHAQDVHSMEETFNGDGGNQVLNTAIDPVNVFESEDGHSILVEDVDENEVYPEPISISQRWKQMSKISRSKSCPVPTIFKGGAKGISWGRIWKELYWLNNQRDYASNLGPKTKWGRSVSLIPKVSKIPRPRSGFKIGTWVGGANETSIVFRPLPESRLPPPPAA